VRLSIITDEISQDLDCALEVCEDFGVRTVELRAIGGANVVSHDQSSLQRVKTTLEDKGFDVCAISSPFLKCHLYGDGTPQGAMHFASPASREEQRDVLERALNVAHLLGAPVVRAFSFWRVPEPASVRGEVVRALVQAVERVQEAGLELGLENEHECNVGTGAEARWVLDRIPSPYFGLVWDPGNEAMMGSKPFPGGYSHVRGRVTHVHLKDVDDEGNWTKVGMGTVDYLGQLRALAEDGYAGALSLETHYEAPGGGPEAATRESVAAIRALCEQAGVELSS
jgi:L-ribulose-5-phosphate 3-epimerase